MLFELCADDAQAARVVGMARADLVLFGHVVEFEPAVLAVHDALGAQNVAVIAAVELAEHLFKRFLAELLRRLLAPGGEDVVSVVMMVVALALGIVALLTVVVMVVMLVLVVIVFIVVMVVMMLMLVVMLILIVVVVVLVVMIMLVMLIVIVMMVMLVLGLFDLVLAAHLFRSS